MLTVLKIIGVSFVVFFTIVAWIVYNILTADEDLDNY